MFDKSIVNFSFSAETLVQSRINNVKVKGYDWIRLVFAHLFPLNNGAPVAYANLISDGKVQVSP